MVSEKHRKLSRLNMSAVTFRSHVTFLPENDLARAYHICQLLLTMCISRSPSSIKPFLARKIYQFRSVGLFLTVSTSSFSSIVPRLLPSTSSGIRRSPCLLSIASIIGLNSSLYVITLGIFIDTMSNQYRWSHFLKRQ